MRHQPVIGQRADEGQKPGVFRLCAVLESAAIEGQGQRAGAGCLDQGQRLLHLWMQRLGVWGAGLAIEQIIQHGGWGWFRPVSLR